MREFFRGWRRKLGCVTLVMALVLMAGWIRSRVVQEGLSLRYSEQLFYSIVSRRVPLAAALSCQCLHVDDDALAT